jgi:FKBP-type peptidyl-prolyl cis-trans isomerase FkpA
MKYSLIAFALILFISCSSDEDDEISYVAENEAEIVDYLATNNLNAQRSDSGLYYIINELGTGEQPIQNSNITLIYKGTLTNGFIFDESNSQGSSFNLQNTILGFREGLTYFKEGGSGILLIPAHLAYGNVDQATIPRGSVLIFEIELLSVN